MSIEPRLTEFESQEVRPAKRGQRRSGRIFSKKRAAIRIDPDPLAEAGRSKEAHNIEATKLSSPAGADDNALASPELKPIREDDALLWLQAFRAVPTIPGQHELNKKLVPYVMALHEGLDPKNAVESIVARCLAVSSIATMECFAQGADASIPPQVRESYIRLGLRGTEVVAQTAKAYTELQNRLIGKEPPTNYTVNVEEGGQAIVGNINRPLPKSSSPSGDEIEDDED
jgi:hypothetical protein